MVKDNDKDLELLRDLSDEQLKKLQKTISVNSKKRK